MKGNCCALGNFRCL